MKTQNDFETQQQKLVKYRQSSWIVRLFKFFSYLKMKKDLPKYKLKVSLDNKL